MTDAKHIEDPDDLLNIYSALRKLKCLSEEDYSLFPQAFLLKVLNERLAELHEFAEDICGDLFRQVGVSSKGNFELQEERQDNSLAIDVNNELKRYPEFDEYFHSCLNQLYDLVLDLHWHNELPKTGVSSQSGRQRHLKLEYIDKFTKFQKTLGESIKRVKSKARLSPPVRRRVQFDDLPPTQGTIKTVDESATDAPSPPRSPAKSPLAINTRDLRDNHSVYALDLLLFGIDIFIGRLTKSLSAWSSEVHADLDQQIDMLFEAKLKIRSKQLQVIAKKIKIYNDVHLTVLDHLSDIKKTYLVKTVRGTLLARDSVPLLENYKNPRLRYYMRRLGEDVEVVILKRLISRCLQILFNLIICEINVPPVELRERIADGGSESRRSQSNQEKLVGVQQNVMNFIGSWLRVDELLFGASQRRNSPPARRAKNRAQNLLNQIRRPQLVVKTSTLSLSDKYTSSSRILAQMDNLGEFTSGFLAPIVNRLEHDQHLIYFFDSITNGLSKFFDVIAFKLERQMLAAASERLQAVEGDETQLPAAGNKQDRPATTTTTTTTTTVTRNTREQSPQEASIDQMTAKIRCLKFVHIMSSVDRIVAGEAARMKVELERSLRPETKVAKFMQACMLDNSKRKTTKAETATNKNQNKKKVEFALKREQQPE